MTHSQMCVDLCANRHSDYYFIFFLLLYTHTHSFIRTDIFVRSVARREKDLLRLPTNKRRRQQRRLWLRRIREMCMNVCLYLYSVYRKERKATTTTATATKPQQNQRVRFSSTRCVGFIYFAPFGLQALQLSWSSLDCDYDSTKK